MNIGFDILVSDIDVTFATQTGIEIICNIIILNSWYIKVSMSVIHPWE